MSNFELGSFTFYIGLFTFYIVYTRIHQVVVFPSKIRHLVQWFKGGYSCFAQLFAIFFICCFLWNKLSSVVAHCSLFIACLCCTDFTSAWCTILSLDGFYHEEYEFIGVTIFEQFFLCVSLLKTSLWRYSTIMVDCGLKRHLGKN